MKLNAKDQKIAENLMQRLLAAGWVKIPPGFKLVPIAPTAEQVIAGSTKTSIAARYVAMVDAAPKVFNRDV